MAVSQNAGAGQVQPQDLTGDIFDRVAAGHLQECFAAGQKFWALRSEKGRDVQQRDRRTRRLDTAPAFVYFTEFKVNSF